jgi:hypothetical protein
LGSLELAYVNFRETRMKFFRVQNMPSAPSAQDNHFRLAFALIRLYRLFDGILPL